MENQFVPGFLLLVLGLRKDRNEAVSPNQRHRQGFTRVTAGAEGRLSARTDKLDWLEQKGGPAAYQAPPPLPTLV